ncbi:aldehyde dehydrogenase [Rhodococcus sp. T2V]|uniref:aldehyde dehydrogenase n=1 Tax=Rhodococcus sp. T2V TaxID=3034164 RepID=UPI0023E09EBF|nr:aldehyde dehydrogenase [Rhodococcus sp. T2V]MDF3312195.1 aldehyde dehydrogenase [Rhodococcus sp. T2V]
MDRPALFIDGDWVSVPDDACVDVVEASTEKLLGRAALASVADIDSAVAAARRALVPWGAMDIAERSELLSRFADAVRARGTETAALVSRENGMPISKSLGSNGVAPALAIGYYAGLIREMAMEDVRPAFSGGNTLVRREPIGVVAAITPWNYPQALAAMKIGPALAAGCTVVLKPAPLTALDAFVFADAALEVGLPHGVINIVPADGPAGAHLVSHPGVDKVAFTGSTGVGRHIGKVCGELLRPVTLELGGKSAAILLEDMDLEDFVAKLPDVSLANNGQTCHACTRILAPRSRYSEVVDAVTDVVHGLRVGDPLESSTQVGPLVSALQRDRVLDYVALGRQSGARLTTGGVVPKDQATGWFVEPTVFADVDNSARIAQEEIFGPVLCVTPYSNEDEAITLANDSEYGLGGTVWTSDPERGLRLAARVDTGTIGVNHYGLDLHSPFGGMKSSGLGRELGPEGIAPYLRYKSVYMAPRQ